MPLQSKLDKITEQIKATSPLANAAIEDLVRELSKSDITQYVLKEGDKIPSFCLESIHGKMVSVKELLEESPIIITFYRGGWCPYCSLELQAWQAIYSEVRAKGYEVVAISPEKTDSASTRGVTMNLKFTVLSDPGNNVTRLFGLVFHVPANIKAYLANYHIDLIELNEDKKEELPIPATYVIDQYGIIQKAFFDVDFRNRKDPEEILEIL